MKPRARVPAAATEQTADEDAAPDATSAHRPHERSLGASGQRRGVRGGDLASRIVAAAAELLDETGDHAAVSLRSIARRAGISAPAIYGHYPNVQSIFFVVVQEAFGELEKALRASTDRSSDEVDHATGMLHVDGSRVEVARLHAVCDAYLEFAAHHPQRYQIMFGGLWTATAALESSAVALREVEALGQEALGVIVDAVRGCVDAGSSTSTDPFADAVALWLGLHGLAHQRMATAAFPWPGDIVQRLVTASAHLAEE